MDSTPTGFYPGLAALSFFSDETNERLLSLPEETQQLLLRNADSEEDLRRQLDEMEMRD